ncbi:dihydroxyacetone kinase subunit DhaL [Nocardiopsis coralliicola]
MSDSDAAPGGLDAALARQWLGAAADAVHADRERLGELDAAIGDGDHGGNMDRGMAAARAAGADADGPGAVLAAAGTALVSKVGGASGPLYGTLLRTAGKALDGPSVGTAAVAYALRAGLDRVRALGGAGVGDATMVDAWEPAVAALEQAAGGGAALPAAASAAADAAEEGARSTIPLQARKGRASYLGERSIGHEDPGAASSVLLLRALAETLES